MKSHWAKGKVQNIRELRRAVRIHCSKNYEGSNWWARLYGHRDACNLKLAYLERNQPMEALELTTEKE